MTIGVSQIVLLVVLLTAISTDLASGKIKNWLTLPAIVIGPVVCFLEHGTSGLIASLAGIGVMVVVVAVLLSFRLFGGGDAKLLVAVGSLGGLTIVRDALLYMGVAGGALAIIVLIWHRRAAFAARQVALAACLRTGLPLGENGLTGMPIRLPYSLAIAAGAVAALVVPL